MKADLARIGMEHPVGDVHQRGLAGAVLTQQRMDLAGGDVEVHPRERLNPAEPPDDAAQLQRGSRGHRPVGWS